MDPKMQEQLDAIEVRVEAIHASVEKIRWYMKVTAWVTIIVFVLPLIGLFFAIPAMIQAVTQASSLL